MRACVRARQCAVSLHEPFVASLSYLSMKTNRTHVACMTHAAQQAPIPPSLFLSSAMKPLTMSEPIDLCCSVLHCTVLSGAVLGCTVLFCAVLYCTALCHTILCRIVLYLAVLHCTVLSVLLCLIVLHGTVLCYTVRDLLELVGGRSPCLSTRRGPQ